MATTEAVCRLCRLPQLLDFIFRQLMLMLTIKWILFKHLWDTQNDLVGRIWVPGLNFNTWAVNKPPVGGVVIVINDLNHTTVGLGLLTDSRSGQSCGHWYLASAIGFRGHGFRTPQCSSCLRPWGLWFILWAFHITCLVLITRHLFGFFKKAQAVRK